MARRSPYANASTIIRYGAAHAEIDIRATEKKTGMAKHETVDLTPSYYMAGREGHVRARPVVKEFVKAVCSLHGIRYGGRKKRKGDGGTVFKQAAEAVTEAVGMSGFLNKEHRSEAIVAAREAVVERTVQHMPMGA